ncbi:MAG: hypothetical protein DCC75_05175 [Proteobacteria bacterium]|nr:MAG: hypothetical protein DCC75_05175 [Pseudomonadota bacterium]
MGQICSGELLGCFAIDGELIGIEPLKSGHINRSFVSTWRDGTSQKRYVHQAVNSFVFPDVPLVISNIRKVTEFLRPRLAKGRRTLKLVPARSGDLYARDRDGQQAYSAGQAFGEFTYALKELPYDHLKEPIPQFQYLPGRLESLRACASRDEYGRVRSAGREIDFALSQTKALGIISEAIESQAVPIRVTHGDAKFNNILFDCDSGRVVCVVDLDTCMPGSILYDFGDLVRSAAISSEEDEPDTDKINLEFSFFEAIARGYLDAWPDLLPAELQFMAQAPRAVALGLGIRFLDDYLSGDKYFRTDGPDHNLIRARAQFKAARSMESQQEAMQKLIKRHSSGK